MEGRMTWLDGKMTDGRKDDLVGRKVDLDGWKEELVGRKEDLEG